MRLAKLAKLVSPAEAGLEAPGAGSAALLLASWASEFRDEVASRENTKGFDKALVYTAVARAGIGGNLTLLMLVHREISGASCSAWLCHSQSK